MMCKKYVESIMYGIASTNNPRAIVTIFLTKFNRKSPYAQKVRKVVIAAQ